MTFVVLVNNIVGLLVPVLVFLDNSSNHHLEQHRVVVPSSPTPSSSVVVADVTGGVASASDTLSPASHRVWDLPNGRVEFHNPFIFDGLTLRRSSASAQQILDSDDRTSLVSETSSIALWDPIFLGR